MLQALQAIHNWSLLYPGVYFGGIIILLCIVCGGWFKLGSMRLAVAGAPVRRHVVIQWRPRPFAHSVLVQAGGISVLGRLESHVDSVGASLAVRIRL